METQKEVLIPERVTTGTGQEFPVVVRTIPSHVYARADHENRCIEVNASVYPHLDPLMREFVMCHEVCHLEWDDHDETRTNTRACVLFVERGTTPVEREKRLEWLKAMMHDDPRYSNELVVIVISICAAVVVACTVTAATIVAVRKRNVGWYSWDRKMQEEYLNRTLTDSFNKAMDSETSTARTFFWEDFARYTAKDKNFEKFINRKKNNWVKKVITEYEARYGFGFDELYKPADESSAIPKIALGVGVLTLAAVLLM